MKLNSFALFFVFAFGILAYPDMASAECSKAEIRKMKKQGMTSREIERECSKDDDDDDDDPPQGSTGRPMQGGQSGQPAMTSRCFTPIGACMTGQTAPVGTPCWCNTPRGPVNGRAQ